MQYEYLLLIENRLRPQESFSDLMALLLIRACFENGIRTGEALCMRIGGIQVLSGTRIEVSISHSKTSLGHPVIYHYHETREKYCFIRLLQYYQHLHHDTWLNSENYLFASLSSVGSKSRSRFVIDVTRPLTTSWLANVLKELSLELDFFDILRCHSLRSSFACALLLAGNSLPQIQKLGRWSSDTYLIYLRDSLFVPHMRDPLIQKMVEVGIGVRSENHVGGMRFSAKKWEVPI
jgi:integrase